MTLTINPAFKDRRVSHHNCCKTVGEHTPYELKDLAIVALQSGNPLLVECFTDLPKLEELVQDKTATLIEIAKNTSDTPQAEVKTEGVKGASTAQK